MARDDQGQVHPSDAVETTADPDAGAPATEPEAVASGTDEQTGQEGHHLLELWSDREEIHALPEILRPAEGLVTVGTGTVVKSARLAQSNWLVVLTDRRLLCIKGRAAVTRKVIDMPVSQIRGVESTGLIRKTLSLDTGYGTLRLSGLKKNFAQEMAEGLTALMGAYAEGGQEKATAIPKADLSKAGTRGHTHEEMQALEEGLERVTQNVDQLKERVTFLEELVRSNVAGATPEAKPKAEAAPKTEPAPKTRPPQPKAAPPTGSAPKQTRPAQPGSAPAPGTAPSPGSAPQKPRPEQPGGASSGSTRPPGQAPTKPEAPSEPRPEGTPRPTPPGAPPADPKETG